MDVQNLATLFAHTLDPNPNTRKRAEIDLRQLAKSEGCPSALMQIVANDGIGPEIRLSCAIFLKNRISKGYYLTAETARPNDVPIADSDKAFIRQNVLGLLVQVATPQTKQIQIQMSSCLRVLITQDFPTHMPNLVQDILALLKSGNQSSTFGGCLALLELVRSMRYRIDDKPMPAIAEQTFPTLVELGQNIANNLTPDNAEFLHVVLKTYKLSTQTALTPHQQSSQSIMSWGRLLFQVVAVQLPSGASLPGDQESWAKSEWWKAKKWAFNTLNRLFERFGNPSQLPASMKKEVSAFAEHFVTAFAPEIFKAYVQQAELYTAKQNWLSPKCLSAILRFFAACVKPKATWAILKPHFEALVSKFVFPMQFFDAEKSELWTTDPIEFIRRTLELDDLTSPSAAGITFIVQLATSRPKATMMPILKLVNSVVASPSASPEEKFGALGVMSALGGVIMGTKGVKDEMENFVTRYVAPELQSPHAYLRHQACEVVNTFERFGVQWTKTETLGPLYLAVTALLTDSELPVKTSAVFALSQLIRHEPVQEALAPKAIEIMQVLFVLQDETELEAVSGAMETFIDSFRKELGPASPQIVERLCQSYLRLLGEKVAADDADSSFNDAASAVDLSPDDEKTMNMMGMLKTLEAVVEALDPSEDPNMRPQLERCEALIVPVVKATLERKLVDLIDSVLELVDGITFAMRAISPGMWGVFEAMYIIFKEDASDYLDVMLPALDNFIDFGKDVFAQSPQYRKLIVEFYTVAMTSDHLAPTDRYNGTELGRAILLNLRGQVDDSLASMLALASKFYDEELKDAAADLSVMNFILSAILYNSSATLHILASLPDSTFITRFFADWLSAMTSSASFSSSKDGQKKKEKQKDLIPRVHDKKLSALSVCALMSIDPSAVPSSLHRGWPMLLKGALDVFSGLSEAIQRRKALAAFEDDDDEDDDLDEVNEDAVGEILGKSMDDDDNEDVWDEEDDYLEFLAAESARLRSKRAGGVEPEDEDGDEDSDDDLEDEVEEELNVETPIDHIDPYVVFRTSLSTLEQINPQVYQAATTSLDVEHQAILMEVINKPEGAGL